MISLPFVIVAALCKSIIDKCMFHYHESVFNKLRWFDSSQSWRNKWKGGEKKNGEAFFLSSSLLVMFTDSFHLFGSIQRLMWIFAIVLYKPTIAWWADGMILMASHMIVFHVLFTYAFRRK